MWNCKIDGEPVSAYYPELHLGVSAVDTVLEVHGNIRAIGEDTLRLIGEGIQLSPQPGRSCVQILDDGEPVTFSWMGILLDNTMRKVHNVILQTTFPNNGPIITIRASRGGDTLTIETVGGLPRFRMIDHDVLDIVVEREVQKLSKLG